MRSIMMSALCPVFAVAIAVAGLSCVRAPNVAVVDSKTALERQAAGEYHALENDLDQAGISPRSEVIPREQLPSAGGGAGTGGLGELAQLYARGEVDADWIDRMLVAGCIGEAKTGLLAATPDRCKTDVDTAELTRVLGRANLHRRQLWQYLSSQRSGASDAQVRSAWRENHLARVVCGGLIESDAGAWEAKSCE